MKTHSTLARLLLTTAAVGTFTLFAPAGPPPDGWQGTQQIKTFSEVQTIAPDAVVTMACRQCKTVMIHETRHVGMQGKGPDSLLAVGSKHTCSECAGEITVVKGKKTDSMQMNCTKCGVDSVTCCATLPPKK